MTQVPSPGRSSRQEGAAVVQAFASCSLCYLIGQGMQDGKDGPAEACQALEFISGV